MERAKGGTHLPDKAERAAGALAGLRELGASLGRHKLFGRVDLVAEHPTRGTRLLEVEADSSRQREQAMYSALGQILLSMKLQSPDVRYGLAVPDSAEWINQLRKIPPTIAQKLSLDLYAVGSDHVQVFEAGTTIPDWSRG
ncbi:MAG TPA: hypothetical protein VNL96_02245 [Gemmatimonadaceae bacterium]|nr:hypothetical protein [Gemmatimonadaceae bacterium]